MRRLSWTTALLLTLTALMAVPGATAQSPVAIVIEHDTGRTVLSLGETHETHLNVRVHIPPLTACLEYEPVRLSAYGPTQLDLRLNPVSFRPDAGPAPLGGETDRNVTLTVSPNRPAPAYEPMIVTVQAEGGACALPGGPSGGSATHTLVFLAAYEPGLNVTTVSVEPSPYGLHLWTVRFTNHGNAETAVRLDGQGDVEYRNLPDEIVVSAPTETEPAPSTTAEILVDNPGPGSQEAVLAYEYGPDIPVPEDEVRTWTGGIAALIPPSADAASVSSQDVDAAELPGFELIPLALALTAAVLLRRRRR